EAKTYMLCISPPDETKTRMDRRDLRAHVALRNREEEDARQGRIREAECEVVEQRVRRFHREAAAPHREDQALVERDRAPLAHTASGNTTDRRRRRRGVDAGAGGSPAPASARSSSSPR